MAKHVMTAARKAALRRAQIASAKKRKRTGKSNFKAARKKVQTRRGAAIVRQRSYRGVRKQHMQYEKDINTARVQFLHKPSRSHGKMVAIRKGRAAGRTAIFGAQVAVAAGILHYANNPTALPRDVRRGYRKAGNAAVRVQTRGRNARFARAEDSHLKKMKYGQGGHVRSARVPQLALTR